MHEHARWPAMALLVLHLSNDLLHLHTPRRPVRVLHDALEVIVEAPAMLALAAMLLVLLAAVGWLAATGCCWLLLVLLSRLLAGCWRLAGCCCSGCYRRGNDRLLLRLFVRWVAQEAHIDD